MKVKELIEKLKEFDSELEVVTYAYDAVSGNGIIERIILDNEYDPCTDEYDKKCVMIDFELDGEV